MCDGWSESKMAVSWEKIDSMESNAQANDIYDILFMSLTTINEN